VVIAEYLKVKYLDPVFKALGYKVGEITWYTMITELERNLDGRLRRRKRFVEHCISWVRRRNALAHPTVDFDQILIANDFETIKPLLGKQANSIMRLLKGAGFLKVGTGKSFTMEVKD